MKNEKNNFDEESNEVGAGFIALVIVMGTALAGLSAGVISNVSHVSNIANTFKKGTVAQEVLRQLGSQAVVARNLYDLGICSPGGNVGFCVPSKLCVTSGTLVAGDFSAGDDEEKKDQICSEIGGDLGKDIFGLEPSSGPVSLASLNTTSGDFEDANKTYGKSSKRGRDKRANKNNKGLSQGVNGKDSSILNKNLNNRVQKTALNSSGFRNHPGVISFNTKPSSNFVRYKYKLKESMKEAASWAFNKLTYLSGHLQAQVINDRPSFVGAPVVTVPLNIGNECSSTNSTLCKVCASNSNQSTFNAHEVPCLEYRVCSIMSGCEEDSSEGWFYQSIGILVNETSDKNY